MNEREERRENRGRIPHLEEGYKCEDVLDSGRNPNGIGSGNRSGGTRIGVRLVERGVTCGMMLGHMGTSSGFPGQELLFAYTQSTPTFTFLPLCFFVSFFSCACIHTRTHTYIRVFTHSNACLFYECSPTKRIQILVDCYRRMINFFMCSFFFLRFHAFNLMRDYWYTVTVISQVHACG